MKEKFTNLRTFINIPIAGFHIASIFLGVIGKRFKDAGIKDFIIESQLLGKDQLDQMLKGKEYNISMHISSRKKFEIFEEWLHNNNKYIEYNGALESAESEPVRSSPSPEKFKEGHVKLTEKELMLNWDKDFFIFFFFYCSQSESLSSI